MFAIIRKDGRQYRVSKGETVRFDRINSELGGDFEAEEVLAISEKEGELKFGSPIIIGAKVAGKILSHGKDKKIIIFKRKRRKTYRRKYGHRQLHTMVKIESISSTAVPAKNIKQKKEVSKKDATEKSASKKLTTPKTSTKKVTQKKSVEN